MTVTLELTPELRARLVAQAQMRGLSLEAFVEQVLRERSGAPAGEATAATGKKAREFETWAHSHPDTPLLSDDAIKREHLIRDAQ
jgi:hypothetical protein